MEEDVFYEENTNDFQDNIMQMSSMMVNTKQYGLKICFIRQI